jgi:hypothetical protein
MKSRSPVGEARRANKSFTLSSKSIAFIDTLRRQRGGSSCSAILEQILESFRLTHERSSIEREFADYYCALSAKEAAEQTEWGEFALLEFTIKD